MSLTPEEICRYLAGSFDLKFYSDRYPDMTLGHVDPLEHYAIFGWKEGRDPCEWFSTRRYLNSHTDVAQKGVDPLLHLCNVWPERGCARYCPPIPWIA